MQSMDERGFLSRFYTINSEMKKPFGGFSLHFSNRKSRFAKDLRFLTFD